MKPKDFEPARDTGCIPVMVVIVAVLIIIII